jgi:hypothetical protein
MFSTLSDTTDTVELPPVEPSPELVSPFELLLVPDVPPDVPPVVPEDVPSVVPSEVPEDVPSEPSVSSPLLS